MCIAQTFLGDLAFGFEMTLVATATGASFAEGDLKCHKTIDPRDGQSRDFPPLSKISAYCRHLWCSSNIYHSSTEQFLWISELSPIKFSRSFSGINERTWQQRKLTRPGVQKRQLAWFWSVGNVCFLLFIKHTIWHFSKEKYTWIVDMQIKFKLIIVKHTSLKYLL